MSARLPLALLAALALVACAEDTEDSPSGTGSSGGNPVTTDPVTVSFQLTSEAAGDTPDRAAWIDASLTAATVAFGRLGDDGACTFDDDEVWALGAFIDFDGDQIASVERTSLCRIRFVPPAGVPLVRAAGNTSRLDVDVTLWLERGVDLVIEEALDEDDVARDFVLAFEPGQLADSVDWRNLPIEDGRVALSDLDPEIGEAVATRLTRALVLYRDPTPGDRRISVDERTDANRVGFVERVP